MGFDLLHQYLVELPWVVFLVVWFIAAFKTHTNQRRESSASRYFVMALMILGYYCLFGNGIPVVFLHKRFVPPTSFIVVAGGMFTWLGIGLCLWARYHLAENWSARVTIKVGHELIRTGPYAYFRHPIYSGLLLATIGTAIAFGEARGLLGVCFILTGFLIKAKKEENMLNAQFGSAFEEHCRQTGFLLPRFH
ncbi:MAG TPA: isoprenylcysteine carboxylmethyltransferase family protein [Terriglobales bacterium]